MAVCLNTVAIVMLSIGESATEETVIKVCNLIQTQHELLERELNLVKSQAFTDMEQCVKIEAILRTIKIVAKTVNLKIR